MAAEDEGMQTRPLAITRSDCAIFASSGEISAKIHKATGREMTATDDEAAAPTSGEDAMFRCTSGSATIPMAEARAGRLTQREFQAACLGAA